ncbi:MAG: hypothetical protein HKN06_09310 [Gammaproteobacteria bacterium]|nr:hypothetical protein [Gammaproteobacteria bacterium]
MTTAIWAAVPTSLNYQGYLTDPSGAAIDTDTQITFSIYNADVGGSSLWSDTRTVPVDQGLFSVELGNPLNPFPAGLFDTPLFIGIDVDGDGEMVPRRPLTSVGFSFKADQADDALSLQGQGPAAYDQSLHVSDVANPHGVTVGQTGGASSGDIANLQAQLDAALATIAQVQTDLGNETSARIAADNAEIAARIADVDAEEAARIAAVADIADNTVLALDGMLSLSGGDTALFDGVNVQVVNGTDTTDGNPNGKGNLIVGYDEPDTDLPICSVGSSDNATDCGNAGGVWDSSHKSGSHNVIVGYLHNYTRYGGLVVGVNNNITGIVASVTGGSGGTASGSAASVSGGINNRAIASNSSVSGGSVNIAAGGTSSIGGGAGNLTSGNSASITGGRNNVASGDWSAVVGGGFSDPLFGNEAYSNYSAILGGFRNVTGDTGSGDRTLGEQATVSGGSSNTAKGDAASVSGGQENVVIGPASSITGGRFNVTTTINSDWTTISGGFNNFTSGAYASISGGDDVLCASDTCGEGTISTPD